MTLIPIPGAIGPTGYMSTTRLPAQKRETSGTRTLETVTLNGGRILSNSRVPATARARRVVKAGRVIWARSPRKRPPCSFSCSLASREDSEIASSRCTGSCRSLASETSIPETWFPSSFPCPSPRVDTGTIATIDCSCSSPRSSSRRRSPPETTARMHVVHRGLEHPADQFHVIERDRERGKAPPIRHRPVERRPRRGEEPGRWLLAPARQLSIVHPEVGHRLHPGVQRAPGVTWLPHERGRRVPQHLGVGGQRGWAPFRRQRHHPGSRVQVHERRQHRGTAHPVEDGVMHLGNQRRATPLEPLDHMHLPQGAVGVELAAHDTRHERVELRPPSG